MPNIFNRISDIITANINDLLDRVEDPDVMIKNIIREMEENIARAREEVIEAIAAEKQLGRELDHHRDRAEGWRIKAESALRAGDEAKTRDALRQKKEHEQIADDLEKAWAGAKDTSRALKTQLRTLENKLARARRKKSMLTARQRAAEAREHLDVTKDYFERGLSHERKFDRMEDRISEMEARAEAVAELNEETDSLERELDGMKIDREVEDELAAMKRSISPGDSA